MEFVHLVKIFYSMYKMYVYDEYIRNIAITRIQKECESHTDNIRMFIITKIDFNANTYYKMIDYNNDWLDLD